MVIHHQTHHIATSGSDEIIDLTGYCTESVGAARITTGIMVVFVAHSTCSITTMEYEPGAIADLKAWLVTYAPATSTYQHNILNHDTNAHAHLRSALLGPGITIPVCDGRPVLGTWQTPILIDFDDRPRTRDVVIQVIGE